MLRIENAVNQLKALGFVAELANENKQRILGGIGYTEGGIITARIDPFTIYSEEEFWVVQTRVGNIIVRKSAETLDDAVKVAADFYKPRDSFDDISMNIKEVKNTFKKHGYTAKLIKQDALRIEEASNKSSSIEPTKWYSILVKGQYLIAVVHMENDHDEVECCASKLSEAVQSILRLINKHTLYP
jgi:hypothetical protein